MLVGPDLQAPFGKAAADWSDADLSSLKSILTTCQAASARHGNLYDLAEINQDAAKLLAKIPSIVSKARDQAQAQARQIEARRQLAAARIDKAAQAKQQVKASAETAITKLEHEAAMAEAEARAANARANARIAQASRARDEARAKAEAVARMEQNARENADMPTGSRPAAPGELSELVPAAGEEVQGRTAGTVTVKTGVDAFACNTIDDVPSANQTSLPPQTNSTAASGKCHPVPKGTNVTIQAAAAGPGLDALCVALEGHAGCLWIAKAAVAIGQP